MGWLPSATRRDVGAPGNYSNGPMRSYTGVVLHVNDADSGDLFGWITGGSSDMSCHFQVLKDGTVYQYIDTAYSSWCQMNGNDDYLSIETSGFPAEPLTAAQVASCARIMAFVNAEHGIPLIATDLVGSKGLIAHGDGGAAWGGHTGCPGDLRKAQRFQILAQAHGATTNTATAKPLPTVQEDDDMAKYSAFKRASDGAVFLNAPGYAMKMADVKKGDGKGRVRLNTMFAAGLIANATSIDDVPVKSDAEITILNDTALGGK